MRRRLVPILVLLAGCAPGLPFFGGPQRARYTIGVTGCGRRMTIVVLCSDNGDHCVEGVAKS